MCRIIISLVLMIMFAAMATAMPPHPEILEKIRSGEVIKPIFMSDPDYARRVGINQGRDESLYSPDRDVTSWNTLAIIVEYSDQTGSTSASFFDSLVFSQGNGTYGPSLRGFFNRASYGNLDIVTVNYPSSLGWKTLPNPRPYYTSDGGTYTYGMGTYPNNSQKLCEDALSLIDPYVDFANYDNNSDSYVDGIIIVHSGRGAEISGDTLDIWSHKWQITPQWLDGVWVSDYCVDPEYRYTVSPNDGTIGVFAHEFGHILGLPDLYDYDVPFDSYGLGYWSLMAYGGWNGSLGTPDTLSGVSPAFLDAWSRVKLGFVTPTNIACFIQNLHIPAVEDSAVVYRLWTYGDTTSNEYFLMENRFQTYTDTALAGFGVLIYHVDDNKTNNNIQWVPGQPPANHYMVALEQADNSYHLEYGINGMDWSDPFEQGWNNVFNNTSSPSSQDYTGSNTQVNISWISNWGYVMMADVDVGATVAPSTPVLNYPDNGSFTGYQVLWLSWDAVLCASKYHCQLAYDPSFTSLVYQDSALAYNYLQYSLHSYPDGWYYWRARAGNTAGWSGWSETRSVMMDRKKPYNCIASSPDTAYSSSFLVTWTAGEDSIPSSGICNYLVWCDSGSGWWGWLTNVDSLSAMYTGARNNNTYYFMVAAQDCALNYENYGSVECSTYVDIAGYEYLPGDMGMYYPVWPPQVQGGDVTYYVNFMRQFTSSIPCLLDGFWCSADVNGSCAVDGADLSTLVSVMRNILDPMYCDQYPTVWPTPNDLPSTAPAGWPNCETPINSNRIKGIQPENR